MVQECLLSPQAAATEFKTASIRQLTMPRFKSTGVGGGVWCRSVFYLPKPRPLNHLVADLWGGPTLVLQGVLDPLNDAKGESCVSFKAASLQSICGAARLSCSRAC